MLGSPLNMAPEVLQNMEYSNKADIYSLGVCYYWMLFGRPPYNAKNINELKSMIVREDYDFPRQINAISEMSKQLIRAMLKANPKARISWEELFKHDINDFLEKKVEKELVLTLTMDGSISDNVCKLYLSQNLVIIHPSDFKKREEAVNIAVNMVRDGKRRELPGELRKKEIKEYSSNDNIKRKEPANNDKIDEGITEDEAITNDIYNNTFYLLNERNKIVFLLSVMNELRARKERKAQGQILMHLLKLTKQNYLKLSQCITERKNTFSLRSWEHFVNSPSFANLQHFLVKEETIVRHEIENN